MDGPGEHPRLRVALDATPLLGARTGVGEFCRGALAGLAARPGLEVSAFAVSWRRRGGIVGQVPEGVKVLGRPMPARPLHRSWRLLGSPPLECFSGPLDVAHGTNFVVPPTRRAARVMTVHDLTTLRFPELCDSSTKQFPELIRRAIRAGAWVHTPSCFVAHEVIELLGADPAAVRAVHHGVPVGPAQEARRPPTLPATAQNFVLSLGTIEPRKDVPGLVRAFDRVGSRAGDVHLVIAGPDGWGADDLRQALASSRCGDRITRLGYVSDAERQWLLAHARVFAYPSLYEGFGFPPLEAMALGVPVVSTDAGALPEVVGDAAVLVPASDPDALGAAIWRAISDGELREDLVRRGRARAGSFSWEACAAGLESLYRDASEALG